MDKRQVLDHELGNVVQAAELAGSIRHHMAFLHQYTSQALKRGITEDDETLASVRQDKHRSRRELGFECFEALFSFVRPCELFILLEKVSHGLSYT